jgi:hypothetical protein
MSKKFILDPVWLNKGTYLDSEYFNYILLAACMKYRAELEKSNIDRFDEIMYHILNLNSLAVNGTLFTPKFKKISNSDRLKQIKNNLKQIYNLDQQTVEIFKNANYVFLNLMLDYIDFHLQIMDQIDIFYKNEFLHSEKNIFIVVNQEKSSWCTIWQISEDINKNFGYDFIKKYRIKVSEIKENQVISAVKGIEGEDISNLISGKNICFIVMGEENDETLVAKAIKNIIFLNRGIAKGIEFEPNILNELYQTLWFDKVLPFTLDQWAPTEC